MNSEEFSWFKFTLKGPVDIVFKTEKLRMFKSKYSVQSISGGEIIDIELIAEFSPVTIKKLATHFEAISEGVPDGHTTFRFVLKDQIKLKNNKEFSEALNPEALLNAASGACADLENFECRGYGSFNK